MTTNITPIEALKQIKEYWDKLAQDKKYAELIDDVLTQALVSQECDTEKCEKGYYNEEFKKVVCQAPKEITNYNTSTFCEQIPISDCLLKQLHSQEKTFTLEEIGGIIFSQILSQDCPKIKNCSMDCRDNNMDCRKCLLAEFEKAVE